MASLMSDTKAVHVTIFVFPPPQMAIVCESHRYSVSVNGKHCFDFSHRVSQLQQINVLEIEGDVTLTAVQV